MAISNDHTRAVLLAVSHYAVPLVVIFFFIAAQIAGFCAPPKKATRKPTKVQRWTGISLTLALIILFVGEGILNFSHALLDRSWWAPQHFVLYLILSTFTWGIIGINFIDAETPNWYAYIGAWALGFVGELVIAGLTASTAPPQNAFDTGSFVLHLGRVTILLAAFSTTGGIQLTHKASSASDEEQEGLLSTQNGNKTSYGSTANGDDEQQDATEHDHSDSSDDDNDDDKEIKEKQRKRFEEEGGVWGYLKGFAVFLPVINPKGNPEVQFYYAVLGLYLLWERFQNVLVPNQIGIVTRKLTQNAGSGILPWKEIGVWVLLRWLGGNAGIEFIHSYIETRIDNFCYKRINEFAFNHVMSLSMDFHDSKDSGEILKSVEQGTAISHLIETFAFSITPMLVDIVVGVIYISYLFDIYIALIALITGVVYFWSNLRLRKLYLPRRREYVKKGREESNTAYEAVGNWQTVSQHNRAEYEENRFASAIDELVSAEYRYYDLVNVVSAVLALIMILGHMSAIYLAAWRVAEGGKDIGSFVTLVTFWSQLVSPLQRLSYEYRTIAGNFVDAERLLVLIQTKPSVATRPDAPDLHIDGAEVEFHDVNFAYDERKSILTDISFTAKPGQTIALVGETGGGKSTTLKLLARYYDVSKGSIMIDGQNIKDVTLNSLRDAIGVVPQDPSLFNRSILENVRYARLDATDEEIYEACKAAAIHDKIMTFPDKYNAKVGERGVKVSGGEKQRLAIARVILRNPKIVMLDEATSAVDSSTEQLIQDAFKKLSESRTTFVIAHRLSTIVEADLILVVDEGKIVERGTHEELISLDGRYTGLWKKQTKEAKKEIDAGFNAISTSSTVHASDADLIQLHDDKAKLEEMENVLHGVGGVAGTISSGANGKANSASPHVDSTSSSPTVAEDDTESQRMASGNTGSTTGLGIQSTETQNDTNTANDEQQKS